MLSNDTSYTPPGRANHLVLVALLLTGMVSMTLQAIVP